MFTVSRTLAQKRDAGTCVVSRWARPPAFPLVVCGFVLALALLALAPASRADVYGSYLNRSASIYWCATVGDALCANPHNGKQAGEPLDMLCWVEGNPGLNGDRKWFFVRFPYDRLRGFVSAPAVSSPRPDTRNCWWNTDTAIMLESFHRWNQAWASSADARWFAPSEWSPGPVNEWAGDCPKLPYAVYKVFGLTVQKRGAAKNLSYYQSRGLLKQGEPGLGDIVFYPASAGNGWLGHEAIYVGNGRTMSTQGMDWSGKPNWLGYLAGPQGNSVGYVSWYDATK